MVNGDITKIWNNPVNQGLQEWNEKVDRELLPNFYTQQEQDAEWWSTDNWATWNFVFDKAVKNAGFAVGAMVGGNIANRLLMSAGTRIGAAAATAASRAQMSQSFKIFSPLLRNTSRAFSQGKNVEAYEILANKLSSIADVSQKTNQMAQLLNTSSKFANFGETARRTMVAAYSSAGEASMEAIMGGNEMKENLIQKYIEENGVEPTGKALEGINETVRSFGKNSFFGNMALLGVTEYIQLPYLAGSAWKNTRSAIKNSTDDVIRTGSKLTEAAAPTTKFGKLYQGAKKYGTYVFDPKETLQEMGQFALQVGATNYFEKANQTDSAENILDGMLNFFMEAPSVLKEAATYGLVGRDEEGEGVGVLVSKEGIEGGILGGLTGGLMQARGKYRLDKQRKSNTQKLIQESELAPTLKEVIEDRIRTVNRATILQEQQQEAAVQNDILESKDLKTDLAFNYAMHKVKYGRTDLVLDELQETKKQVMSSENGFSELQSEGIGNINDTKEQFLERITEIENFVKDLDQSYDQLNTLYGAQTITDSETNQVYRKYSDTSIEYMAYSATKIKDYDKRILELNNSLGTKGIASGITVLQSIIENNKPNREAVEKTLQEINKTDISTAEKNELKSTLTDLIELSLRRKSFLQEYNDVVENPNRYRQHSQIREYGYVSELDVTVEQKDVIKDRRKKSKTFEKKIKVGKEYSLKEQLRKENNELQFAPKITVLSQTLDEEFKVLMPDGSIQYLTPSEFKDYNISDESNTSETFEKILDKAIDKVLALPSYKEIGVPQENESKLEFINSLNNEELINNVEKEFNKQASVLLKAIEEERILNEKLILQKKALDEELARLAASSTSVESTSSSEGEFVGSEDNRKDVGRLFLSTTTPSEDTPKGIEDSKLPHIKRSRNFLNNFKFFKNRDKYKVIIVTPNNAKELGLDGIIQISYKNNINDELTKEQIDPELGFMAQVFIMQTPDGNFFVNEKGEKLNKVGEESSTILDNVVFQTMTSASLFTQGGFNKVRSGQETEAETYLEAYKIFRQELFEQKGYTPYPFSISRGISNQTSNNKVFLCKEIILQTSI